MVIEPLGLSDGHELPGLDRDLLGPGRAVGPRRAGMRSPWFQFLAENGVLRPAGERPDGEPGAGSARPRSATASSESRSSRTSRTRSSWLLKKYPQADASRVGIHGWSFGGFMTGFALTHSKMFRLGIAGAGVYDWRLYDTIYTERYMDTPQNNPEGYKKTSVIEAGEGPERATSCSSTARWTTTSTSRTRCGFAYELEKADKQFDVMIYPKSRHGLVRPEAELAPPPAHVAAHAGAVGRPGQEGIGDRSVWWRGSAWRSADASNAYAIPPPRHGRCKTPRLRDRDSVRTRELPWPADGYSELQRLAEPRFAGSLPRRSLREQPRTMNPSAPDHDPPVERRTRASAARSAFAVACETRMRPPAGSRSVRRPRHSVHRALRPRVEVTSSCAELLRPAKLGSWPVRRALRSWRSYAAGDSAYSNRVPGIALPGDEPGPRDRAAEVGLGHRAVRRSGLRDHVLLHHRAAHVVAPEAERALGAGEAHRRPRRLEVRDVVEIDRARTPCGGGTPRRWRRASSPCARRRPGRSGSRTGAATTRTRGSPRPNLASDSSCLRRIASNARRRWRPSSPKPNTIVTVVERPSAWASPMIRSQAAVFVFLGETRSRISSSRISPPPPGQPAEAGVLQPRQTCRTS